MALTRAMLNKVPQITFYFWVIKILCTTVGETGADFLNTHFGLGLTGTSLVMGVLLLVALFFQFASRRYKPSIYWLTVVLISVVGTLITDNMVDNFGIPLMTTTVIFGTLLALTFGIWYALEKTLSIHSIRTPRREAFYWLAILFTFALGTAAGDLVAESLSVGYLMSAVMFGALIALVYVGYRYFKVNTVLAFWAAYILTRPLGASIGDYLSQDQANGGLGMGTVITSGIFLVVIIGTVGYLIKTRKDVITEQSDS